MFDRQALFSVETIENGFLVVYTDLVKVKERIGMPQGMLPPPENVGDATVLVQKRKFCKDAEEVSVVAKSICDQAHKIKAFLDDRGGMPGMFTQA